MLVSGQGLQAGHAQTSAEETVALPPQQFCFFQCRYGYVAAILVGLVAWGIATEEKKRHSEAPAPGKPAATE